jgi:hypothetical protein
MAGENLTITPLDLAWEEINAMPPPELLFGGPDVAFMNGILAILERHGARDPIPIRHKIKDEK